MTRYTVPTFAFANFRTDLPITYFFDPFTILLLTHFDFDTSTFAYVKHRTECTTAGLWLLFLLSKQSSHPVHGMLLIVHV
jgi:hypothetical protein